MSIALAMTTPIADRTRLGLLFVALRRHRLHRRGRYSAHETGRDFGEPPGAIHRVSANASNTEWAELIAVFVADEGAQLTTLLEP